MERLLIFISWVFTMNKFIVLILSLYSFNTFADSSGATAITTWKAVAIKDSTRSKSTVEISSLGVANLTADAGSSKALSSGNQKIYNLPLKQDIPEHKLFTKVLSNTLANEERTAELEVDVFYGNKPIAKSDYQQILTSGKKDDFSFKVANANQQQGHFNGNVDVGFMFYWEGSQSL